MNYPEDLVQAANYLKQAIPHLVKHKIAANPVNYALWYNYVGNRIPALTTALEKTIKRFGTCSFEQSQELYARYIIGDSFSEQSETLNSITKLATHIAERIGQSRVGSETFNLQLDQNIKNLKTAKALEEITGIIDSVINTSETIKSANDTFVAQMAEATQQINGLRLELQQAEKHAYTDQLTQLYNRHAFDKQLKQLIQSKEIAKNVCLILLDLDFFKSFNDNYGHIIGDRILQRMGELLHENCPANAISARYGGEEFAIIITKCGIEEAVNIAESIRQRMHQITIKTKNSAKVLNNISASFGVAQFRIGEKQNCFVDRADQALYRAKHNGRNTVEREC